MGGDSMIYIGRCTSDGSRDSVQYAQLSREDTATDIDNVTYRLIDLASKYNGEYDGWECEVTSEKE
jgi:regulator of RNase E activity RraB